MQDFYSSPFDTYYLYVWLQSPGKLRFGPRKSVPKHIAVEIEAHKAQIIDVIKSQPACSCGASDWRYEPLAYDEAGGFVCRKCLHARRIDVDGGKAGTANPESCLPIKRIEDLIDGIMIMDIVPDYEILGNTPDVEPINNPTDEPVAHPESPPNICAQCGARRSDGTILGLSETGIWLCSKCYYSKKKRKSKKKAV